MYEQFYGLAEAPFNLTPDCRFLYLSERHREAMAALLFGIQERKGFLCLTGEVGSGKTMLCRALLNELRERRTRTAVVFNSFLSGVELLRTINDEFGIDSHFESKKDLVDRLNRFLIDENRAGNTPVLVIDEAQNLPLETLEQIRMLSNLESETAKLLQIVLVGQPQLANTLAREDQEQLEQRIGVRYHIQPLREEDVLPYIRHRLNVAQAKVQIDFTDKAVSKIAAFSAGIPRKINVLCDRCLLIGYVSNTLTIDGAVVQRAIKEIGLQTPGRGEAVPSIGGISGGTGHFRHERSRFGVYAVLGAAVAVLAIAGWFGLQRPFHRPTGQAQSASEAPQAGPAPKLQPTPSAIERLRARKPMASQSPRASQPGKAVPSPPVGAADQPAGPPAQQPAQQLAQSHDFAPAAPTVGGGWQASPAETLLVGWAASPVKTLTAKPAVFKRLVAARDSPKPVSAPKLTPAVPSPAPSKAPEASLIAAGEGGEKPLAPKAATPSPAPTKAPEASLAAKGESKPPREIRVVENFRAFKVRQMEASLPADSAATPDSTNQLKPAPSGAAPSPLPAASAAPAAQAARRPGAAESTPGNWVYDENRIVRVKDPELSLAAAVLTAARLWNLLIDLSVFREAGSNKVGSVDIFSVVERQLSMSVCDLGVDLTAAFRFDLPMILALKPGGAGESPFQVAEGLNDRGLALADPLHGQRQAAVRDIVPRLRGIRVLYHDRDDLKSLKPGEGGERVRRLQEFLAQGRWFEGAPSGVLDEATANALGRFQESYGIPQTRRLDDWTSLLIASRRLPSRPRLMASR